LAIRYKLLDVADRLGLEYTTRGNISCPFCKNPDKRKTLHLDDNKDYWRCNKCKASGGVLHLFSELCLGYPLPSTKEGKNQVKEKLQDFMGDPSVHASHRPQPERKKAPAVPVANDDKLHAVYSAMSELPDLQLNSVHKKDLINRGFTEEIISRNGYRSIPDRPNIPDVYAEMYENAGGEALRESLFSWYSSRNVQFGLMIAHKLVSAGFDLNGVPGFFRFGDRYCLWYASGLLIPTRNEKGQIVIWQVRQKKHPKYLTLSCGSLPGAVTDQVSRCHYPIGNSQLSNDIPVIYTEGPLKADVALHLSGNPSVYLAIPGINTTKDLIRNLRDMKRKGVREVFNGLDMDRLTNPNVWNGSDKLKAEIQSLGISVRELYWASQYARSKLMSLNMIAKLRNVPIPQTIYPTVYDQLAGVARALDEAGIDACKIKSPSGKSESFYWDPDTKGIDDFYLHYTEDS
jgi:hypothetical protein